MSVCLSARKGKKVFSCCASSAASGGAAGFRREWIRGGCPGPVATSDGSRQELEFGPELRMHGAKAWLRTSSHRRSVSTGFYLSRRPAVWRQREGFASKGRVGTASLKG